MSSRFGGRKALDEAVELIGRNVTAVQADSANLDDPHRLFDAVVSGAAWPWPDAASASLGSPFLAVPQAISPA